MNRFFTKQQVVIEYHLPPRLHAELFRGVQPVEQDDHGEPLYLEEHLDRWLTDRFSADQTPDSSNEPFMTKLDSLPGAQADYLSIKEAAALTRLSYSHVRRAVLSGELPASNVGSGSHAIYRIARSDLTVWMNTKKRVSAVPPRSELRGLVNRYFPDP
jgi:excisionase family DNA binding protein